MTIPRTALTAGDNLPGDVKANHPADEAGAPATAAGRNGGTGEVPSLSALPPGAREGAAPKRKRRPKDIGTADETAAVRALHRIGFPGAERRALRGRKDVGDILVCPGIIGEVKGGATGRRASDYQIFLWLTETEGERVNAGAAIGILIVPRFGIGPANAERWWAIVWTSTLLELHTGTGSQVMPWYDAPIRMRLIDLANILRYAGYGTPPPVGEAS